jgi:hypothetical protein
MVKHVLTDFLGKFEVIYNYSAIHPEVALLVAILAFLVLRGKIKSALILLLGAALCLANYFIFLEYNSLSIPLYYAAAFAGISVFLLLLLVYQFIHSS